MVDPDDNKESVVTRLRGSQRTLAVIILTATLVFSGIALADVFPPRGLGFENQPADSGTPDGTIGPDISEVGVTTTTASSGNQSMYIGDISGSQYPFTGNYTDENPTLDPIGADMNFSGPAGDGTGFVQLELQTCRDATCEEGEPGDYVSFAGARIREGGLDYLGPGGWEDLDNNVSANQWVRVTIYNMDPSADTYTIRWEYGDNVSSQTVTAFQGIPNDGYDVGLVRGQEGSGNHYLDNLWPTNTGTSEIEGTVTNSSNEPIENVTVVAEEGGEEASNVSTDLNGNYQMHLSNGEYNVTASKDGYFTETQTVTLDNETVTADFQLQSKSETLTVNTRPFLKHGETVSYTVTATVTNQSTGEEERMGVTDSAIISSGDPSVITVDTFNHDITATSDTSVNNRTYLQAQWTNPATGETLTGRQNVTVANLTADNLAILPPVERFSASLSGGTDANPNDKTIMLLIIGAAAGAAASLIATSFAGVAALTMTMMLGWIMGATSNGMAIVTVFIALFVGLNVAGNVDYTVRR